MALDNNKEIPLVQLPVGTPTAEDWVMFTDADGKTKIATFDQFQDGLVGDLTDLVEQAEAAAAAAGDKIPSLTVTQLKAVDITPAYTSVFVKDLLKFGTFVLNNATTLAVDDAMVIQDAAGNKWERTYDGTIELEWFGALGDYNYLTNTGTPDTTAIRAAVNFAAIFGCDIKLRPGKKYLTDTLYLYQDGTKNPTYPARPGRVRFFGAGTGIATGDQEPQGSCLIHINGAARPLIECIGAFSIENPTGMGGQLQFERVNLCGGNQSTDVVYLQGCQGQISMRDLTVQGNNPSGNGITQKTVWEFNTHNLLVRGQASGAGTWTGIGHNILCDASNGQINMQVHENMDIYKWGINCRIGRRDGVASGTFSTLVFIGGQYSLADLYNLWLGAGVLNFLSVGQQFEGSQKSAVYISSAGETDLTRNVKFIAPYITGCGIIDDGTDDSFAFQIRDGVNVTLDAPLFNNLGNGIIYDRGACQGLEIIRPTLRTVRAYGASSGTFLKSYGTTGGNIRVRLFEPTFNASTATLVETNALTQVLTMAAGGRLSISSNAATVDCGLGGGTLQAAGYLNFNNSNPTTITNITGGQIYRQLALTFSNTNTKIASNSNIFLAGGVEFQPTNRSVLTLVWTGTYWQEVARSGNGVYQKVGYLSLSERATFTGELANALIIVDVATSGVYLKDSADTTSSDDGYNVLVVGASNTRYKRVENGLRSVKKTVATSGATPVNLVGLRDTVLAAAPYGGTVNVFVKGTAGNSNSAFYQLMVIKESDATAAVVSLLHSAGLTAGGSASHPSFTFDMNSDNLRITPVGSTSGSFSFHVTSLGSVVLIP